MLRKFFDRNRFSFGSSSIQSGSSDLKSTPAEQGRGVKIYVSLTTIPSRVSQIQKCIDSLLVQTQAPEKIFLCVPKIYKRFGTAINLPASLSDYGDRLAIIRCSTDYGPGTKLLGSVDLVPREQNSIMTLVDDDVIYKNYMLEMIANAYNERPQRSYSFYVRNRWSRRYRLGHGVAGFALPTTCLDDIWPYYRKIQNNEHLFFVDDLWISNYLHLKGIPIVGLGNPIRQLGQIYSIYNDSDALVRLRGRFSRYKSMFLGRKFLRTVRLSDISTCERDLAA